MNKNLNYQNTSPELNATELIVSETKRLADLYGKSFLDCDELIEVTGLGRDNVRALMKSGDFPVIKVGNRNIVSIANFVAWQINGNYGGNAYGN